MSRSSSKGEDQEVWYELYQKWNDSGIGRNRVLDGVGGTASIQLQFLDEVLLLS